MFDLPFRLLSSLIIGFFVGMAIDNALSLDAPIFTITFSILGLIGGIWSCIKKTL